MGVGVVLACILVSAAPFMFVHAADPDALQDFCVADVNNAAVVVNGFPCKPAAAVKAEDFKSDVLKNPGDTNNVLGFMTTAANVAAFPGLNTLGVSFVRIDFGPGGLNPPHFHPRASEVAFIQQGVVYIGFISNNKLFAQTLYPGELFVIPRGLLHFQLNICNEPAVILSGFNSQSPGLTQVATAVFASNPPIADVVIEKAFQLSPDLIQNLRDLISKT